MVTLREWLAEEPFTLALSAGFFGFFAHAGVLSALDDAGLLPERVTGASAGALVGGLWAAGLDACEISGQLTALRREDFWDPGVGLGLLRGELFRERLDAVLPVREFAQCRVPAAISTYDVFERRTRVFTSGLLAPAIRASCTFPGLFQPAWYAGRPFLDGGILDRATGNGQESTRVLGCKNSSLRIAEGDGEIAPGSMVVSVDLPDEAASSVTATADVRSGAIGGGINTSIKKALSGRVALQIAPG
jgi:NTE family protein